MARQLGGFEARSSLRTWIGAVPADFDFSSARIPIASLAGLESLESVGSLDLETVSAPDLSALANLRRVHLRATSDWTDAAYIVIEGCDQLRDLSGLKNLAEWDRLYLQNDAQLESLQGLGVPAHVDFISLASLPQLKDVSALAPISALKGLVLAETGLETVADLQVKEIDTLSVLHNLSLRNLDGLKELEGVTRLSIERNPSLERLPELRDAVMGLSVLQIIDNAELRSIPQYPANTETDTVFTAADPSSPQALPVGFELLEIVNNPRLTDVALPAGLDLGRYVGVYGNASLTILDLGELQKVDILSIKDNAALNTVALDSLKTVDEPEVTNNPQLPTADFAKVRSFERNIAGNLEPPAP